VNQHTCICGTVFPWDVDPVTKAAHPTCPCSAPTLGSNSPPTRRDGQSILCEVNKFDDMIDYISVLRPGFSQVIAVDENFRLFQRAWCVAELYAAFSLGLKQTIVLLSSSTLDKHQSELLQLRIEDMGSSNPADKAMILSKIDDREGFDNGLQRMIMDESGLLRSWRGDQDIIAYIGVVAKRSHHRDESQPSESQPDMV